jgi:hypothetical protein
MSLCLTLCFSLMVLDFELWISWFLSRCFPIYVIILALCIGNVPFHFHPLLIHCSNLGPGGPFLGCADVSANMYIRSRSGSYSITNSWGPHAVAWPHSSCFIICKLHENTPVSWGQGGLNIFPVICVVLAQVCGHVLLRAPAHVFFPLELISSNVVSMCVLTT